MDLREIVKIRDMLNKLTQEKIDDLYRVDVDSGVCVEECEELAHAYAIQTLATLELLLVCGGKKYVLPAFYSDFKAASELEELTEDDFPAVYEYVQNELK